MKKMSNYDFDINWYGGLTEEMFLNAMRTNNASDIFEYDNKYGDCYCLIKENKNEPYYRAIASLENGNVAIEADFWMNEDFEPVIDFSIYIQYSKWDKKLWCTEGFFYDVFWDTRWSEDDLKVHFTEDNWKEQLETDMFNKLDKYCKYKGYDYTKPIDLF